MCKVDFDVGQPFRIYARILQMLDPKNLYFGDRLEMRFVRSWSFLDSRQIAKFWVLQVFLGAYSISAVY